VAGESVTVVLHSAPTSLGTVKAGAAGKVTFHFTVPAGLSGSHQLVFTGASRTRTFAFHVAAVGTSTSGGTVNAASTAPLAHTGAEVGNTVGLACVLLLMGAGALMTVRPKPRGRHR
jgi:uncharacterized membrane protein